jgi:hypothetical protein
MHILDEYEEDEIPCKLAGIIVKILNKEKPTPPIMC